MCPISAAIMSWVWVKLIFYQQIIRFLSHLKKKILLKISIILTLLTFMYLVALYQKTELQTVSSLLRLELKSSFWQKLGT